MLSNVCGHYNYISVYISSPPTGIKDYIYLLIRLWINVDRFFNFSETYHMEHSRDTSNYSDLSKYRYREETVNIFCTRRNIGLKKIIGINIKVKILWTIGNIYCQHQMNILINDISGSHFLKTYWITEHYLKTLNT